MGRQIVKQPNGCYAVWSTVVDDFIAVDMEPAEITACFIEEEAERIVKRVDEVVEQLNSNGRPYYQFTKTFEECIALIRESKGQDAKSLKTLGLSGS